MTINKKEDLRVIKTKNLIYNSFIELAKKYGYQKITIKDLCDKAMINRNTFYLHYQNKDDLVREMINSTINKYKDSFLPLTAQFYFNVSTKDLDSFSKNIETLLHLLYEDIDLYRIILNDDFLTGYFRSVEQSYEKNIIGFLNIRTDKAKLIFRYTMSGCAGILTDWMVKNTLPIPETAMVIAKLVLENIRYFNEENRNVK